ncbi:MAG: multiubiquitin domain-containing protein [Actinobacteria bacterium]|nr:multiubiquitin domain-containing protein [Actinomycetota bacterium]
MDEIPENQRPDTAHVAPDIELDYEGRAEAKSEATGPPYIVEVDGVEYRLDEPTVTGGELMDLAGIPREVGLLQILDDGTQQQVGPDDVIELKPGRRFKKRPRFKRG